MRRKEGRRIRVARPHEDLVGRALLDDRAQVHDRDAPRQVRDDRELMRDEEDRDARVAHEVLEQVEDLGLDRDIQGADRLVREDELGTGGECASDRDALALAAGQLARPPVPDRLRQAHAVEHLGHVPVQAVAGDEPVHERRLTHGLSDRERRVQRRIGVLEHHLGAAADLAELVRVGVAHVDAIEADLTAVRLDEADEAPGERRLAAAGFADEPERLVPPDRERDVIDSDQPGNGLAPERLERAAAARERLDDMTCDEERDAVGTSRLRRCRRRPSAADHPSLSSRRRPLHERAGGAVPRWSDVHDHRDHRAVRPDVRAARRERASRR